MCAALGELAELRRKDIDPEQRLIRVRRAVTFPPGGAVVGPTKSEAGVRDVSIPPHVWPIIEEHLEKHVRPGPNMLLFPGEGRGHMWHSVMGTYFAKARKAAGREDLRWHDLRHTGATLAAQGRRHHRRTPGPPGPLHHCGGTALSACRQGPRPPHC